MKKNYQFLHTLNFYKTIMKNVQEGQFLMLIQLASMPGASVNQILQYGIANNFKTKFIKKTQLANLFTTEHFACRVNNNMLLIEGEHGYSKIENFVKYLESNKLKSQVIIISIFLRSNGEFREFTLESFLKHKLGIFFKTNVELQQNLTKKLQLKSMLINFKLIEVLKKIKNANI